MITILLLIATLALIYFYIYEWKFKYWERHGIPGSKPRFPYGTMVIGGKEHLGQIMHREYKVFKNKSPIYGGYRMLEPVLFVTDINLTKDILIKDFNSFHSRGLYENRRDEPLISHLFILSGQKWKKIREKITPVFTSGKIRGMAPNILNISHRLVDAMSKEIKIEPNVDIKEWMARFTTDVIGTCGFGLECNSIENPNAEFRMMGRKTVEEVKFFNVFFGQNFPWLARKLHVKVLTQELREFYLNTVKQNVEYRLQNNIKRNDFLDLMINLYNKDKTNEEKDWDMEGLSIYEIAAQCFVFFFAGFESSSNAITYTLLEFARNPNIQKKAREHVKEVLKKHNGEMSYEMLQDLAYIDQCVLETLRVYPLGPFLVRVANENYKVPNTNYTIPKGQSVFLPILATQMDSEYFPNPEKYDPERFATKDTSKVYMPFGDGHRACIGERFAKMETRLALAVLLLNFEFELSTKTQYPPAVNTSLPIMSIKGEMYLKMKKI